MSKSTDVRIVAAELYFLPIPFRIPLKFGREVTTEGTCARVHLTIEDRLGRRCIGWGESPLAVVWGWPSLLTYNERHERMKQLCRDLVQSWPRVLRFGHPIELSYDFQQLEFVGLIKDISENEAEPISHLAALLCLAPFDLALHDAYGQLHQRDIYRCYDAEWMNRDLASYFKDLHEPGVDFQNKYPVDFLASSPLKKLPVWHLVGGLDPLDESEVSGPTPNDRLPVTLLEWIEQDQLDCLKVKLRGNDADWDYQRLLKVGQIAIDHDVHWLSADFNCTVTEPSYVNEILDQLSVEHPQIFARIAYVEQPFPYDLDAFPIDVHSVSSRKPLYLDESAHDWRYVRKGRKLGWSGVALKTCKTQSGALLSLCWAKSHGMPLMVQDLTNPMLAQIPHVRLAAHAETICGVESNGMQFCPAASDCEAKVHPGLYQRRNGVLDLSTLEGAGFGYQLDKIERELPQRDSLTEYQTEKIV
ncbi:MAG: hypothetical protein SGJ20_20090 [Planctomycetota bacterium]|nr:hypothetical protein [Planctomycetota bacterium]